MRAGRIIAVSPDEAFGRQLAEALREAGAVELAPALAAPAGLAGPAGLAAPAGPAGAAAEPALYVLHLGGDLARPADELRARVPGTCPVIAVLPRSDLVAAVALMQAWDRVAAVLAAEGLEARRLTALAARLVADDVFGLAPALAPGTELHTREVGDHREKAQCLAAVDALAEAARVPSRLRAAIEQCLDEMLMNALYDAPVDAQGRHVFAGVPASVRVTERTAQRAAVAFACDGRRLAISVRDAFGSLGRETVLRHLHKGLHSAQQVDRKVGGAGLGVYLMARSAAAVAFHVLPGIATEAVCVFDLVAPAPQLEELAFLVQRDPRGRVAAGPARRISAVPRRWGRIAAVAAVCVLASGAGAFALARRGGGDGAGSGSGGSAAVPVAPVATVELDSQPTGAAVKIDGAAAGSTPLTVTTLAPGTVVTIVFERTGYRAATARLEVPALGATRRLVQPLEPSDELVRVRFVSRPAGAEVVRTGEASSIDRTYTPAEVFVEAGKEHRFTLTMPGRVPVVIEPFTPARGTRELEKGGDLVPGAALRLEAPAGGTATVTGAPHCAGVALPAVCTLAPGSYAVEYRAPGGGAPVKRTVKLGAEDTVTTFEPPKR